MLSFSCVQRRIQDPVKGLGKLSPGRLPPGRFTPTLTLTQALTLTQGGICWGGQSSGGQFYGGQFYVHPLPNIEGEGFLLLSNKPLVSIVKIAELYHNSTGYAFRKMHYLKCLKGF